MSAHEQGIAALELRTEFFCPGQPAADERVAEILAAGGFAFAQAEHSRSMSGHYDEYQGHRVHYLTLDDMQRHVDAARKALCPCPPGMKYHALNCPVAPGELRKRAT